MNRGKINLLFHRFLLSWAIIVFIAFINISCTEDAVDSHGRILLLHLDELFLDVTNDTAGYYSKDTVWIHRDDALSNLEINFTGETDTLTEDCMANISIYYFIDTVHQHIFSYSQFGRDSVNRVHNVSVNLLSYRNEFINYEFLVYINKQNNLQIPQYIRLRNIEIYQIY